MATDDREKALDAALGQIEKQFGKGSIMRMGENMHMNIESIPTGRRALVRLDRGREWQVHSGPVLGRDHELRG